MKAALTSFSRKNLGWLLVLLPMAGAGFWLFRPAPKAQAMVDFATLTTTPVKVGEFIEEIKGSGEVESSSNAIVRCEVRTYTTGVAILQVVDEGTYVNKGDFLMRLDDSVLQLRRVVRQIDLNTSRAELAQAKADLESANLALEEYQSGTFLQQQMELRNSEFVAAEELRRAEEYLRHSEELAERGYVSTVQLEADRFAVEKAKKARDVSRMKLEVYRTYSREKMLNQLQAAIETATSRLTAAEQTHAVKLSRMEAIEEQIQKCTITAPTSGQVVYAKNPVPEGEPLIEPGKLVREMQDLIRLPDPKRMQVTALVNESRIERIKAGMPVRINIDALPDLRLAGEVAKVGEFPMPQASAYAVYIKNYPATITIQDPPDSLRAGMTAEIAIRTKKQENAVMIPNHAVVQRTNRFFCLVPHPDENRIEFREIEIGGANDQNVLVETGLDPSERVVVGPEAYLDKAALPSASVLAQRKKVRG